MPARLKCIVVGSLLNQGGSVNCKGAWWSISCCCCCCTSSARALFSASISCSSKNIKTQGTAKICWICAWLVVIWHMFYAYLPRLENQLIAHAFRKYARFPLELLNGGPKAAQLTGYNKDMTRIELLVMTQGGSKISSALLCFVYHWCPAVPGRKFRKRAMTSDCKKSLARRNVYAIQKQWKIEDIEAVRGTNTQTSFEMPMEWLQIIKAMTDMKKTMHEWMNQWTDETKWNEITLNTCTATKWDKMKWNETNWPEIRLK